MALHPTAHRTGLGGSVEDRPAVGQAPRIGPRQPQPVERALAVLLDMVLEAGARVQHGLVAQDLEIAGREMHAEHVLRPAQHRVEILHRLALGRAELRYALDLLGILDAVAVPFAEDAAVARGADGSGVPRL